MNKSYRKFGLNWNNVRYRSNDAEKGLKIKCYKCVASDIELKVVVHKTLDMKKFLLYCKKSFS